MGRRNRSGSHSAGTLIALAVVLAVAGCAAAPHRHGTPSPPGGLGACRLGQLGAAFGGVSQPGTGGTALGIIGVWNKSPVACRLPGPVVVAGLGAAGRRVTTAVRLTIAPRQFALTPDGRHPDQRGRTQLGSCRRGWCWRPLESTTAATSPGPVTATRSTRPLSRSPCHPAGRSPCPTPAPPAGPAGTRDGGLLTCQGRLAGQSPISITRSWPVAVPAALPSVAPAQSSGPSRAAQAPAALPAVTAGRAPSARNILI